MLSNFKGPSWWISKELRTYFIRQGAGKLPRPLLWDRELVGKWEFCHCYWNISSNLISLIRHWYWSGDSWVVNLRPFVPLFATNALSLGVKGISYKLWLLIVYLTHGQAVSLEFNFSFKVSFHSFFLGTLSPWLQTVNDALCARRPHHQSATEAWQTGSSLFLFLQLVPVSKTCSRAQGTGSDDISAATSLQRLQKNQNWLAHRAST